MNYGRRKYEREKKMGRRYEESKKAFVFFTKPGRARPARDLKTSAFSARDRPARGLVDPGGHSGKNTIIFIQKRKIHSIEPGKMQELWAKSEKVLIKTRGKQNFLKQ